MASPLRGRTWASYPAGRAIATPVGMRALVPGVRRTGSLTQALRSTPELPAVAGRGTGRSLPGSRRMRTWIGGRPGAFTSEPDPIGRQVEAREVAQHRQRAPVGHEHRSGQPQDIVPGHGVDPRDDLVE